jgi:hypothetical protein
MCNGMKNITLAVDEATLKEARRIAVERDTTINGLVREYLRNLSEERARKAKAARELKRFFARLDASKRKVGPVKWDRDAIYEGRIRR